MLTKTKIALVAALILAPASVALAGNDNAANNGEVGGIKIGPLGQVFGTPDVGVAPSQAFGQGSSHQVRAPHKRVYTR
jgi:hypothetical protein